MRHRHAARYSQLHLARRAWLAAFASSVAVACAAEPAPVGERVARVFVLAGQSNMEGQAVVDLDGRDYNDGKGTLATLFRELPFATRFAHLRGTDGSWTTRDDVFVSYQRENRPLLAGPLGMGYAVYGGRHHFGPELQFGHVVGDFFARRGEPVVLVKTAWGGKSLFADFRPPSVGPTTDTRGRDVPAPGPYYTRMIADVKEAVAAVPALVPGVRRGELTGFVWWHGWNDGVDPKLAIPAYEENLAALVRDVRRDLAAPGLPVVVGELTGPWVDAPPEWERLRASQKAVTQRDEFRGTTRFVPTRDFVRAPEQSPNPGHGHHEFGNAETYLLVGDALGRGMVELLDTRPR
ncbi:MAG: sialate O-acetylesterase [Planctomycetes bacterium]|nr:sialate O-acetylesterase [Planctomycetota bacterium]